MESTDIIKVLNDLIQLDVDAVEAYGQAIRHVKYEDIRKKLEEFERDHRGHIETLSVLVRKLDAKPVKPSPDVKGYLIEAFTALRSVTGTKGAIEAMQSNEVLTNRKYGQAASLDLPPHILRVVKDNLAHEETHLDYIRDLINFPRHEL